MTAGGGTRGRAGSDRVSLPARIRVAVAAVALVAVGAGVGATAADARARARTVDMGRGDVVRVVTHARVVCVFVENRTVHDARPRIVTKVVGRPCPPSVEPDVIVRPEGAR